MKMDRETVREWKAGYEVVNQLDLEEARNRTPEERYVRMLGFVESLGRMGLLKARPEDLEFRMGFQKLRERWLAKYS